MASHLYRRLMDLLSSHDEEQARASQRQREATVDLLVWTMFVDRHVASPEQEFLRRASGGLAWESQRPLDVFLDGSVRRIRDALGSEASEQAYIRDIAARLPDPESRRRAVELCEELAGADGELAAAERAHLDRIRACFEL
jgi:hypothetical protein